MRQGEDAPPVGFGGQGDREAMRAPGADRLGRSRFLPSVWSRSWPLPRILAPVRRIDGIRAHGPDERDPNRRALAFRAPGRNNGAIRNQPVRNHEMS
jgi:hypothetical protein